MFCFVEVEMVEVVFVAERRPKNVGALRRHCANPV